MTVLRKRADFADMRWPLSRRAARLSLRQTVTILLTAMANACDRSTPAVARKDTVVPVTPPPETTVVAKPEQSTWDSTAGPALFVVGATPSEATIIIPRFTDTTSLDSVQFDLSRVRAIQIELFASGKRVGAARVGATASPTRSDSCRRWPTARLDISAGDTAAAREWTVGFETGHATAVALDSIASLPTADSARFAADIARIASSLPGDTATVFRGLPFVVNNAWRMREPNGQMLVAAVVIRNVNQEANPRQERILLLAARDTTVSSPRYVPQYFERITGLEETVETTDLVAMVLLGADRRPTLIVARDAGHGLSFALIEQIAGKWQHRWGSAYSGC